MMRFICSVLILLAFALAVTVLLEFTQYIANQYEDDEEDKTE